MQEVGAPACIERDMQMSACATALNERCRVYLLALRVALPDPCSLSEQRKQWRRLCAAIMQLDAPGSAQRVTRRPSGAIATRQARFRPWEQQDLLLRLHTFKSRTWFGKPSQINALACAIHGWTNTGPDRLACEVCNDCTRQAAAVISGRNMTLTCLISAVLWGKS